VKRRLIGGLENALCKNGCRWIFTSSLGLWTRVVRFERCNCRSPRMGGDTKARKNPKRERGS
jgi:hypothetical protein